MTKKVSETTFFKLRSAREYRFYNRLGQRMLNLLHDQVLRVAAPEDIAYFRSRPDVVTECLEDGTPLNEVGRVGHYIDGKAKSYRVYGRGRNSANVPGTAKAVVPAPKTVAVGAPPTVRAPQPVASVAAASATPGEAMMGIPATKMSSGSMSPIEEASRDGSTRAVRPTQDPGK